MITWTKFVLHPEVEAYKAAGWVLAGDLRGTPHGHWSVIMKWNGEGDPVVPKFGTTATEEVARSPLVIRD